MAMVYTAVKRFHKALQAWLAADSTLVTLTGHNESTPDFHIFVFTGDEIAVRPSLLIRHVVTLPWLSDVDGIFLTQMKFHGYAETWERANDIIGAVIKKMQQDPTTQQDAQFTSDNITTLGIRHLAMDMSGEEQFEPTSIRRTERSDVPIADRNVAEADGLFRWRDTSS